MQDDALMATATPREALMFSANMRLPPDTPRETLVSVVDNLLEELGLMVCADVIIGGALIKGISGGQRKRTSVGVEVITNPEVCAVCSCLLKHLEIYHLFLLVLVSSQLLFLDEPTTGLDSHSASNLVHLLKLISAKNNSAILCTIHQPSSEVFALFDIVIFMKAGRIFYQGPVSRINTYYAEHDRPVPENFNPADFVMNLSQALSGDELEKLFLPIPDFALLEQGSSQRREEEQLEFHVQSSFGKQMVQIAWREAVNTKRDVAALVTRFSVTIILNLLFGLIFLNVGGKSNADSSNINAHTGGILMAMVSSVFGAAQPIMLNFPFERPMFLREATTGTCKCASFALLQCLLCLGFLGATRMTYSLILVLLPLTCRYHHGVPVEQVAR